MTICFGQYDSKDATGTVQFPISFTTTPRLASNCCTSYNQQITGYYYPYNITTTGFTRQKTNNTLLFDYIAIGY